MADIKKLAASAVEHLKSTEYGRIGNVKLRGILDIDEDTYEKVKNHLISNQTCITGRGRGGSLILNDEDEAPEPAKKVDEAPRQPTLADVTRSSVPYQVEGRDYESDSEDDVVKKFEHRPHNRRNEYCLEVFEVLRQHNLSYPGIRSDRQEVDRALRSHSQLQLGILERINDKANDALESVGLAIDPNIGLIKWNNSKI